MNILYIAFKDFSVLHYGASKKVISACRALEELGNTVTLLGQNKGNTVAVDTEGHCTLIKSHSSFIVSKLQPLFDKKHQIEDIKSYLNNKHYDMCYIRFDLNTKKFLSLLKVLRIHCDKILIEIPTYPYTKEYTGFINSVRLAIDDYYAKKIKDYVDMIVTFYKVPGGYYYGVPVKVVPNGFDFSDVKIISTDAVLENIDIAAVSSMRLWHGYERLIEGLHLYYENRGDRNIILHLVGDGRECPKYKELVSKYKLEEHVVFHGALHGVELEELLEKCTLGLDSLARHRTGISVLSSLKSREYGAKGIPIINSCDIDIIGDDFEYFLKTPADETPIDINEVIHFYDKCYKEKSRLVVAKRIRNYIETRSDMKAVMNMIIHDE